MRYETSIGLETHVQLNTNSKMFCRCATSFAAEPNSNVCPICLGYPGALPLLNRESIKLAVMSGLMLGCEIAKNCKFDRKNYFYPDASKNYQITQYDMPICLGGGVDIGSGGGAKRIRLTRIHLEEDVAKNIHHPRCSGVDFNRAGTPLMEIVSEPDMASADEVVAYLKALKQILVYANVSDCNLEEGNMRCDVNISIRPEGQKELGTKIEIKNMNSFSHIHSAALYEVERQKAVLESGGRLRQETRRWDPETGETSPMRSKENAHDYRYFPEPDLLPVALEQEQIDEWAKLLPEMPDARRARFVGDYKLPDYDAKVLCAQLPVSVFFEDAVKLGAQPKAASNWIMTDVLRLLGQSEKEIGETALTARAFAEILKMVDGGAINMPVGKELLVEIFENGGDPAEIVKARGLAQVSDSGAIEQFARDAAAANPKVVEEYRAGKKPALQFLVGQVMKMSKGKANPKLAGDALEAIINPK
jgi:aspartyl/glutamyl-tRNA(Asn/Gln) amidotransferase, B subunit